MKKLILSILVFVGICGIAYAGFTQFDTPEEIVIPAQEEKVYDKLWMASMMVHAPSPTEKATLQCTFIPMRYLTDAEGNVIGAELKPYAAGEEIKNILIEDLFGLAQTNQKIAVAMEAVFQALKEYGGL